MAGLIFVSSPLAWFHGTVALTYIVEAFFSALIGYFCWRVYCGASRFVFPAAAALGLAAGFRQSSLLVLAPLLLFSIRRVPRRLVLWGMGALSLVLMAWFIPMLYASGGMNAYASSLWSLWRLVPARQTVFTSSVFTSLARLCLIVWIYALCFGCAALLPLRASKSAVHGRIKTFTWIWLSPGLLLFTFVYLKFVNSGYLLVLFPPACIWLGFWAADWYRRSPLPTVARIALLGAAAAVNCAIFLRAPLYFSYREVQRTQHELTDAVAAVRQIARPERNHHRRDSIPISSATATLDIICRSTSPFSSPKYLWRPPPEYSRCGIRTRGCSAVSGLVPFGTSFCSRCLLQTRNIASICNRSVRVFPPGELRVTARNGLEFLTGPVSALAVLFPNAVVLGSITDLPPHPLSLSLADSQQG